MRATFGHRWFIPTIRVFLGLVFILYGMFKLFHLQLVTGDFSDTRFGQVRPQILTWIFFNHSPMYRYAIGIAQIITGILLIVPRTAPVGAFCFFVIIVNIVLINFGYDIATDVKILSSVLLLLDCLLLIRYWPTYRLLLLPEAEIRELSEAIRRRRATIEGTHQLRSDLSPPPAAVDLPGKVDAGQVATLR